MCTRTERIRAQNDRLRVHGLGGLVVVSHGIAALPERDQAVIMAAVQAFSDFSPDNDPHGEHDCALLEAAGHRVMFKIDYYDRQLGAHSPDPADPEVTRRVLTLMFSSEY